MLASIEIGLAVKGKGKEKEGKVTGKGRKNGKNKGTCKSMYINVAQRCSKGYETVVGDGTFPNYAVLFTKELCQPH